MIHSVRTQLYRLQDGGAPNYELIEVLETVKDEARYRGCIVKEDGEKWPDQSMFNVHFWADRAIDSARKYIRCETIRTTATPDTMDRLKSAVVYHLEKIEGCLS